MTCIPEMSAILKIETNGIDEKLVPPVIYQFTIIFKNFKLCYLKRLFFSNHSET